MRAAAILARYDAEMRADPPDERGVRHERVGAIVRAIGSENHILYADLAAVDPGLAVAEQAAFFRAAGAAVEWKVYGHDGPPRLGRLLAEAGFEPQPAETLMAFDLAGGAPPAAVTAAVETRRIFDVAGLQDLAAVSSAAFGRIDAAMLEAWHPRLDDPSLALYVAYHEGRPVSAARMELPAGRAFASLWGGGTAPTHRGRGFYRALVAARAEEALRRGYRFLVVEARETSRPILERLGFVGLTSVTGWVLSG